MKNSWLGAVSAMAVLSGVGADARANADTDPDSQMEPVVPYFGTISAFQGAGNPLYGELNPLYGTISPFWGTISPFWGTISPFSGDVEAFWGTISAFSDPSSEELIAFWGTISAFWETSGQTWRDIYAQWGTISAFTDGDYSQLASDLNALFESAEQVFGEAVMTQTGQSLHQAFLDALLARFGIDTRNPQSLADLSAEDRSAFFLAFYDGLMAFSGADRVDHWMPAVRWSPRLAQNVGGGAGVNIGVVDFSLPYRLDGMRGRSNGQDYLDVNHGLAVAELITARIDGEGLMGVAPNASIRLENPFDQSLTASWSDVTRSVSRLLPQSDIINLSLGVPGWTFNPNWAEVFSNRQVSRHSQNALFVFAAGNDGLAQSADIDWTKVGDVSNLIIVGSVNPAGEISSFSNRPGDACFTVGNACPEGHRLMDRFLVAPGELILVPDGEGGFVRMSGTSFAAPLVSGAAALVQGRWNWLSPADIANVLLWSARDLGEPGVDPVYGWGMLDIEASFRPFNPQNLYHIDADGRRYRGREFGLLNSRILNVRQGQVIVFEDLQGTFRDFEVPIEELNFSNNESDAYLLLSQAVSPPNNGRGRGNRNNSRRFADAPSVDTLLSQAGPVSLRLTAGPASSLRQDAHSTPSMQARFELVDSARGSTIQFGFGAQTLEVGHNASFGLASDHWIGSGGANPVLGLAMGGPFIAGSLAISDALQLEAGLTSMVSPHRAVNPITGETTALFETLEAYSASALTAGLRHNLTDGLSVSLGYTRLHENDAILGAQGLGALNLDGGAITHSVTFGMDAAFGPRTSLAGSATLARTSAARETDAAVRLTDTIVSNAFQLTLQHEGVFGRQDAIRLSLIQPLSPERGELSYSGQIVADRRTGEIAAHTQTWELGGSPARALEFIYDTPIFGQRGDISLFARADAENMQRASNPVGVMAGFRVSLDF